MTSGTEQCWAQRRCRPCLILVRISMMIFMDVLLTCHPELHMNTVVNAGSVLDSVPVSRSADGSALFSIDALQKMAQETYGTLCHRIICYAVTDHCIQRSRKCISRIPSDEMKGCASGFGRCSPSRIIRLIFPLFSDLNMPTSLSTSCLNSFILISNANVLTPQLIHYVVSVNIPVCQHIC